MCRLTPLFRTHDTQVGTRFTCLPRASSTLQKSLVHYTFFLDPSLPPFSLSRRTWLPGLFRLDLPPRRHFAGACSTLQESLVHYTFFLDPSTRPPVSQNGHGFLARLYYVLYPASTSPQLRQPFKSHRHNIYSPLTIKFTQDEHGCPDCLSNALTLHTTSRHPRIPS